MLAKSNHSDMSLLPSEDRNEVIYKIYISPQKKLSSLKKLKEEFPIDKNNTKINDDNNDKCHIDVNGNFNTKISENDETDNLLENHCDTLSSINSVVTSFGAIPKYITHLYMHTYLNRIYSFLHQWTKGYIWHNEPLHLNIAYTYDAQSVHFCGKTSIGDSIDDEWFIIFLLYQLSNSFPDLIITVCDNDGEVLLIECGDILPKWMNSNSITNRVFIYQGNLNIIPRNIKANAELNISEALHTIVNPSLLTLANSSLQERITSKLSKFPKYVFSDDHYHYAKCFISRRLAYILSKNQCLVAKFVNAFMNADPLSFKSLASSKILRDDDSLLLTTVKFTKLLFAQLNSESLPLISFVRTHMQGVDPSSEKHHQLDIGLKLTLGFDLFLASVNQSCTSLSLTDHSVQNHDLNRANDILNRLDESQYFIDNDHLNDRNDILQRSMPCSDGEDLLNCSLPEDADFVNTRKEDSLEWMEINPEDLENRLQKMESQFSVLSKGVSLNKKKKVDFSLSTEASDLSRSCTSTPHSEVLPESEKSNGHEDQSLSHFNKLENIARSFETFLSRESDYRGIEMSDDDDDMYNEEDSDSDSEVANSKYNSDDFEGHSKDSTPDNDVEDIDWEIEREILDTIYHDPDLLMKMIEKSEQFGFEYKSLIEKLRNFGARKNELSKDNEPIFMKNGAGGNIVRPLYSDTESDWSSEEDVCILESPSFMDLNGINSLKSSHNNGRMNIYNREIIDIVSSDEEADDKHTSYIAAEETNLSAEDSDPEQLMLPEHPPVDERINLVENILTSFDAEKGSGGPSHTLLSSMGILLPRNDDNNL